MKFNLLILLLTLNLFTSCGGKSGNNYDQVVKPPQKSTEALQACNNVNLIRDIDYKATFVYNFFRCSVDTTADGGHTLPGTYNVLDTIGVNDLQSLIDLSKLNPQATKSSKVEYPFIRSTMAILERSQMSETLVDGLQSLLLKVDGYFLGKLVFDLNNSNYLDSFIQNGVQLLDKVNESAFFGLTKTILLNQSDREVVVKLIKTFNDNELLYSSLKNVLTIETTKDFSTATKEKCLNNWLDPKINDLSTLTSENCLKDSTLAGSEANGKDRIEQFITKLGPANVDKVSNYSAKLVKEFSELSEAERASIFKRTSVSMKQSLLEQKNPVKELVALLNLVKDSKAKDLDPFFDGLLELISDPNAKAIYALSVKTGASRLRNKIEKLMINGGQINGCPGLTIPGFKALSEDNSVSFEVAYENWSQLLRTYLTNNSKCEFELPPLISYVVVELKNENRCGDITVDPNDGERFCPLDEELVSVSNKFKAMTVQLPQSFKKSAKGSSSEQILKEFVVDTLTEAKAELIKDKFYLRWKRLSGGAVNPELLENLKIDFLNYWTSDANAVFDSVVLIAKFDEALEKNSNYSDYLFPNFIETLLQEKIALMNHTVEQFTGLADMGSDLKTLHVLSGVYTDGPIEQVVKDLSYLEKIQTLLPGNLLEDMPNDQFRLREMLSRIRSSSSVFKDNRLDVADGNLEYKLLGDKSRGLLFDANGFQITKQGPLNLKDVFDPGDSSFHRFKLLLQYGDLIGKDVDGAESDKFVNWIQNKLYPYYTEGFNWISEINAKKSQLNSINLKYFNTNPYSVDEARSLVLFYSMNNLVVPAFFPDAGTYSLSSSRAIKKQFVNSPTIKEHFRYSTFLNYRISGLKLNKENVSSFNQVGEELFNNLSLSDYQNSFTASPWEFKLDSGDNLYKIENLNEAALNLFKVYNSLNLISYNTKNRTYMPLVGIGNDCFESAVKKTNCPLNFVDGADPEDTYRNLKTYIGKIYVSYYCPFVVNNKDFSNEFVAKMKQNLNLDFSNEAIKFCENDEWNLFKNETTGLKSDERYPIWLQEIILKDLFSMGKNPQIKDELKDLTLKIKFIKLYSKHSDDKEYFISKFINAPFAYSADVQSRAYKKMSDDRGFKTFNPGMLNSYLRYFGEVINENTNVYEKALNRYGARVAPTEDPERGKVYDVLVNFIIAEQRSAAANDLSLMEFGANLVTKLREKPEYYTYLSELVSYPEDIETLSISKQVLLLLFKHLRDRNVGGESEFSWNNKDIFILKQFMRQENIRGLTDIFYTLKYDEVNSLLKTVTKYLNIFSSATEISNLTNETVNLLNNIMISQNSLYEVNLGKIEKSLLTVLRYNYSDEFYGYINRVITLLSSSNVDFNNQETKPVINYLPELISFSLVKTPTVFYDYQQFSSGQTENYFQTLVNKVTTPLILSESDLGLKAVVTMVEDPNMGSYKTLIRPFITNDIYKNLLYSTLKIVNRVNLNDVKVMLSESNSLLNKTHKMLSFLVSKAKWNEDVSTDTIKAVETLVRLSDESNTMMNKNLELINAWLAPPINNMVNSK